MQGSVRVPRRDITRARRLAAALAGIRMRYRHLVRRQYRQLLPAPHRQQHDRGPAHGNCLCRGARTRGGPASGQAGHHKATASHDVAACRNHAGMAGRPCPATGAGTARGRRPRTALCRQPARHGGETWRMEHELLIPAHAGWPLGTIRQNLAMRLVCGACGPDAAPHVFSAVRHGSSCLWTGWQRAGSRIWSWPRPTE